MPFIKYTFLLPLFVNGKSEFHADTAEDCQRVCKLSRSCNFWNFSKTERATEGFDLICQLVNSGKRVSGVSFKKSDESVEEVRLKHIKRGKVFLVFLRKFSRRFN